MHKDDLFELLQKFDKSGDGKLSVSELKEAIESVEGVNKSDKEVKMIINMFDVNCDQLVNYGELISMYAIKADDRKGWAEAAFRLMDTNGDRRLTAEELKLIYSSYEGDDAFDNEVTARMVKMADKDGDGKISMEEFVKLLE